MENVTRYTCGAGDGMYESKEGYYVDYADYKLLLDKYNKALSQHDVMVELPTCIGGNSNNFGGICTTCGKRH